MLSEEQKNVVAKEVIYTVTELLEKEAITEKEGQEIAGIAVKTLDEAQNEHDIVKVYDALAQKWPHFKNLELIQIGKLDEESHDEAAQSIVELLRAGKLEHAMALAKTETENDK